MPITDNPDYSLSSYDGVIEEETYRYPIADAYTKAYWWNNRCLN